LKLETEHYLVMNMIDPLKLERQKQGVSIWRLNKGRGTLNYIMRFGKTKVAELAMEEIIKSKGNVRIITIVPNEIAFNNIKHFNTEYGAECYTTTTLYNAIDSGEFDCNGIYLVIIDEIHKMINPKFKHYIDKLDFKFGLGLTGNKINREGEHFLVGIGFPIIDIISEEEALENNWISKFTEYNLPVEISEGEKKRFKIVTDGINEIAGSFRGIFTRVNAAFKANVFNSDFDLIQSCYIGKTQLDDFGRFVREVPADKLRLIVAAIQGYKDNMVGDSEYIQSIKANWNPEVIRTKAKSYHELVKMRNDYIKYNISKINVVLELVSIINKPTIIYNDSVDMIEHLHSSIRKSAVKYHSYLESVKKLDDKGEPIRYKSGEKQGQIRLFGKKYLKDEAINSIKNGKALFLITGRSLNESLNLPNVEYIICTSGDTNELSYDQRVARGKTIDISNKDKHCIIINLFIDNYFYNDEFVLSRDRQKLEIRQKNVKDVIFVDNIADIFAQLK